LGGFDISGGTGVAYAAINGTDGMGVPNSTLYTIDLTTGLASPVGLIGIDNSQFRVTGLSVAPVQGPGGGGNGAPVPAAALTAPALAAIAGVWSRRWRGRRD
jgi:hypothetical protein